MPETLEDLRRERMCPDCARREVRIAELGSIPCLHSTLHSWYEDICLFEMDPDMFGDLFDNFPLVMAEVLHDPGCPKLNSPGVARGSSRRGIEFYTAPEGADHGGCDLD